MYSRNYKYNNFRLTKMVVKKYKGEMHKYNKNN